MALNEGLKNKAEEGGEVGGEEVEGDEEGMDEFYQLPNINETYLTVEYLEDYDTDTDTDHDDPELREAVESILSSPSP